MIADCEAGKIDMVLAKSISRFARDTVDCLNTTRRLKELKIPVYFEREKINTMTAEGELLLTLLASFAQEEARSISENVKWATRKRFMQGIPNGHKAPYGYRWGGEIFKIIPEQGEIVKEIYQRYLAGESAYGIAKGLANRGVTAQQGRPFEESTLKEILSSRSYTGTMVLQKNFFAENKARKKNHGELPMYLVEDMYEALISEADYDTAQEIREKRAEKFPNNQSNLTVFSGKVKCGCCGKGLSRRNSEGNKRWVCNTRERKGMKACGSRPIKETELIEATEEVLGCDIADLPKEIRQITVFGDRLEYTLQSGRIKTVSRHYELSRGKNPFTNKIYCRCGAKCVRRNRANESKVWRCQACQFSVKQSQLIQASQKILGENYKGLVVENVEKIILTDENITFEMKGDASKQWRRE